MSKKDTLVYISIKKLFQQNTSIKRDLNKTLRYLYKLLWYVQKGHTGIYKYKILKEWLDKKD